MQFLQDFGILFVIIILKTIKNATDKGAVFLIRDKVTHFVYV